MTPAQFVQLSSIKHDRVRTAERMLQQERQRLGEAESALDSSRESLARSEETYLRSRQHVLDDEQARHNFARLRAADAYSQNMSDAMVLQRSAVEKAEAVLEEQQRAVARAALLLQAACREREKTDRQRESLDRLGRLAQARRQDLELQEFLELRSQREKVT
jgi:hypothetical protein